MQTVFIRRNPGLLVWGLVLVLGAALILSGCGEEEEEPGDAQLGSLEVRHTVVVKDVEYPFDQGADGRMPGSGMQFVRIDITVRNESSRELILSPANFRLETEDGSSHSVNLEVGDEDLLPTVITVPAGETVSGTIIYEVPLEAIPAALVEDLDGRTTRIDLP